MDIHRRVRPLVLVLGLDRTQAEAASNHWRSQGAIVVRARDTGGCLRTATSAGPDVIVLDPRVPERTVRLLKAHPVSSTARVEWLPLLSPARTCQSAGLEAKRHRSVRAGAAPAAHGALIRTPER
jgi:hypothetical protein